jgi:hypothetical protein
MRTETYDACDVLDATDEPVCDCGELMTPIPPVGWICCRCLSEQTPAHVLDPSRHSR